MKKIYIVATALAPSASPAAADAKFGSHEFFINMIDNVIGARIVERWCGNAHLDHKMSNLLIYVAENHLGKKVVDREIAFAYNFIDNQRKQLKGAWCPSVETGYIAKNSQLLTFDLNQNTSKDSMAKEAFSRCKAPVSIADWIKKGGDPNEGYTIWIEAFDAASSSNQKAICKALQ